MIEKICRAVAWNIFSSSAVNGALKTCYFCVRWAVVWGGKKFRITPVLDGTRAISYLTATERERNAQLSISFFPYSWVHLPLVLINVLPLSPFDPWPRQIFRIFYFILLVTRRKKDDYYIRQECRAHFELVLDSRNVTHNPIVRSEDIILPTLHV